MPRFNIQALNFALVAALVAFGLAAFSPALLNDSDTYWHIRTGQWMLAHHAVLRADVFSYTAGGAPWHTQEWLAEIAMALSWQWGWKGIHILFGGAAALAAGVTSYFVRRRVDFVPALLTVVLGLACVTGSLLARPHMLALPLLAIWSAGLAQAREQNKSPSWWLILVMPIWANLHGSFVFGLGLAIALAIEAVSEKPVRRQTIVSWALFVCVATAACLLTPFGIDGLLFPLRLSTLHGLSHIGEWQPSDFSKISPFAIALLAGLGASGLGKVKVSPGRLVIVLAIVWLALSHSRHQMLFGVTAPILLAPWFALSWPVKNQSGNIAIAPFIACGFLLLVLARFAVPIERRDDPISPVTALAHVPRFVRETPVLNDYSFGGYLIWTGIKPFIDSRADLYGDIFLNNYAAITSPDKDVLIGNLAYYHVRWTIFSAHAPIVKILDATPGWHRLYSDEIAVVHVHD